MDITTAGQTGKMCETVPARCHKCGEQMDLVPDKHQFGIAVCAAPRYKPNAIKAISNCQCEGSRPSAEGPSPTCPKCNQELIFTDGNFAPHDCPTIKTSGL